MFMFMFSLFYFCGNESLLKSVWDAGLDRLIPQTSHLEKPWTQSKNTVVTVKYGFTLFWPLVFCVWIISCWEHENINKNGFFMQIQMHFKDIFVLCILARSCSVNVKSCNQTFCKSQVYEVASYSALSSHIKCFLVRYKVGWVKLGLLYE